MATEQRTAIQTAEDASDVALDYSLSHGSICPAAWARLDLRSRLIHASHSGFATQSDITRFDKAVAASRAPTAEAIARARSLMMGGLR